MNFKSLNLSSKNDRVVGLPAIKIADVVRESCVVRKQHRDSFPKNNSIRASRPVVLIHAAVCGPMCTSFLNDIWYFVVFVNDFSGMTWVYFVKEKSEVLQVFKNLSSPLKKQSEQPLKILRIERGGEFVSTAFDKFYEDHGIQRQLTTNYTPQQNGVVERKNVV